MPPRPPFSQILFRVLSAGPLTDVATVRVPSEGPPDPNPANDSASFTIDAIVGRCTSSLPATRRADRVFGAIGGDVVNGLAGADLIRGRDGDDCLNGGSGGDRIDGGRGDDLLKGSSGNDVIGGGPGRDTISGGTGNDRIDAADGARDRVNCGPGRDTVRADRVDRLRGCERIRRAR